MSAAISKFFELNAIKLLTKPSVGAMNLRGVAEKDVITKTPRSGRFFVGKYK